MRRRLPSLASLQAFEAVARHLSFSRAADELSLTQSAVSRQVAALEDMLNLKLLNRVPHRLTLTDAGATYFQEVREALERLAGATLRVMASRAGVGVLNVAITPSLAAKWFVPRLQRFYAEHPGITILLTTRSDAFDLRAEGFDAAINTPNHARPGMATERLFDTEVIVVCTPELRDRYGIAAPRDLAHVPLLQHRTIPALWSDWFSSIEESHPAPTEGLQLDQIALVVEAALLGFGVAILPHFYARQELASGRLVVPFEILSTLRLNYVLIYPPERCASPLMQAFRNWLLGECRDTPEI
ncbi:MAG TPA: LysR substrate-binding domain-containing protein [Stellaceae bacterium]|nr:LysR substrate-binding domain-containing protein [Stellaceae bacterium]